MYTPILKNHVNGCHGNHSCFKEQKSLTLTTIFFFFISVVPMNDLALWEGMCKVGQTKNAEISIKLMLWQSTMTLTSDIIII